MNEEKRKKAEMLLESIGDVDDEILDEALGYRKKQRINTKMITIAASFAIIFAIVAGSELIKRAADMAGEGTDTPPLTTDAPNTDDSEEKLSLDSVFEKLSSGNRYSFVTDPDTLPYLDGNVYIVWQYDGEERYYISKPLSDGEFGTIKNALGKGSLAGNTSPVFKTRVWVLLGDGRVISPYLEGSPGNISSSIFDYEVEIIPNKSFAYKVQGILG